VLLRCLLGGWTLLDSALGGLQSLRSLRCAERRAERSPPQVPASTLRGV
jgi:hypothetical protein